MPGLIILRPVAATSKSSRGKAKMPEKITGDRERAAGPPLPQFRPSRVQPIVMPSFRPDVQSNYQLFRSKQVTDPLADNVRARLIGNGASFERVNYSSSGSEHEPSSICLAAMVDEFLEKAETVNCGRARCNCEAGSCIGDVASPEDDDSKSSFVGELTDTLQGLSSCVTPEESTILAEVVKAMNTVMEQTVEGDKNGGEMCSSSFSKRRSVMMELRSAGYNAALCKSRWNHAGSFPGGDYEYVDVLYGSIDGTKGRIIVDIEFQSQFEIARPSLQYKDVFQALPSVYVGTSDRLQQILNVISDAVKRSLKKKGMLLPPWRKPEYMRAKWFSSYRRTTNGSSQSRQTKDTSGPNISSVAVRGIGWDKQFTNELEIEFERAGSRQVLREMKNGVGSTRAMKTSAKVVHEEEPEGAVRGANRLKHLWDDIKHVIPAEISEGDDKGWQPPALLPRASTRTRAATGLTSIFKEAGQTSNQQTNFGEIEEEILPAMVM